MVHGHGDVSIPVSLTWLQGSVAYPFFFKRRTVVAM